MLYWRSIRTIEALKEFRVAFAQAPAHEKTTIINEMCACLDEYQQKMQLVREVKKLMPPQAEKPLTRPRRVRNGRSARRG